jgi:geranylgeranyl reductase family protein
VTAKDHIFDVAVVGAGPAGSTCAFYLAQQGQRVLLLEKCKFPRDKLCGDAVCGRAQVHLRRMGVLEQILAEKKGHWAEVGGMVSPRGISFIGNSAPYTNGAMVIAVKRIVLDEKLARAAQKSGAHLVENYMVAGAEFDAGRGVWMLHPRRNDQRVFRARMLVACDGASSSLARSLGIVHSAPDAVCSRAYVKAGTHNFQADGVVYYPRELVPGYCALFREAGDELNIACYIIPGGRAVPSDLHRLHAHMIHNDPHVSNALGPRAQIEKMRGGGLRLGGVSCSYADHLLVVGDAAGHIDPLTGEGIHYAMDAAELAAQTVVEAFTANDLSAAFLKRYQARWRKSFGRDFDWSSRLARVCARFPGFLDACAAVTQRRGVGFLAEWGSVMTGSRPKSAFFRPRIVLPILWEAGRQWLTRGGTPRPIPV